jgi:hypothetical protein
MVREDCSMILYFFLLTFYNYTSSHLIIYARLGVVPFSCCRPAPSRGAKGVVQHLRQTSLLHRQAAASVEISNIGSSSAFSVRSKERFSAANPLYFQLQK